MQRRTLLRTSILSPIVASLPAGFAVAQDNYPSRPVQLTVAIQAGGAIDIAARVAADAMGSKLGQPFVVENRAGAGGIIGMTYVANAKADGYSLLFGTAGPIAILPQRAAVLAQIDPLKAFQPIALLYSVPMVLIVKKDSRFKTLRELIDFARKNPGELKYGSTGVGSINHIAGELFSSLANVSMLHVPYKGTAPIITDMVGGRVDIYFATLPSWKSSSDKFTVLAVAAKRRSPSAPEFPTSAEAGLLGFEFDNWGGVFAPAATPQPIVDKLRRALEEAMKDPAVREKFRGAGNEPDFRAGPEAKAEIEAEFAKMKKLVRDRNLNLDS